MEICEISSKKLVCIILHCAGKLYLCIRNRETNGPFEQRATLNKVSKNFLKKTSEIVWKICRKVFIFATAFENKANESSLKD